MFNLSNQIGGGQEKGKKDYLLNFLTLLGGYVNILQVLAQRAGKNFIEKGRFISCGQ